MGLHCDRTSTQQIATNPHYHERTKDVEVDCDFIQEKVENKDIKLE